MSNKVYHNNVLSNAWYVVSEVLFYEQTWDRFYQDFSGFQVEINVKKVFELETNWSDTDNAEVEYVQLSISVYDSNWNQYHNDLVLNSLEVRCLDRLNYPEGFTPPDPADYQYAYPDGIREIPKVRVV